MKKDYFMQWIGDEDYYQYLWMLLIRRAEEEIQSLFSAGKVDGTTHLYVGQEANAVGVLRQLSPEFDYVISNHRCHGHFLAFGGLLEELFGEVMGRACGASKGLGGSQHIKGSHFFSSGIQGGFTPIACGLAMGAARKRAESVTICCIGDGTLGQGVLYESMNIASLWSLPVIFFVENNGYAQTTPTHQGVAGSILARGQAFGIRSSEITSSDVAVLAAWGKEIIQYTRKEQRPYFAVINTQRLCPHSKGDDSRTEEEIAECKQHDPLIISESKISAKKQQQADALVDELIKMALATACDSDYLADYCEGTV